MTLSATTVTVLLSVVIPVVTGLLTKLDAPAIVKGAVALTLSAAAGLVATAVGEDGGAALSQQAVGQAAIAWAVQLATYLGIWQPLDLNRRLAPDRGIGGGGKS